MGGGSSKDAMLSNAASTKETIYSLIESGEVATAEALCEQAFQEADKIEIVAHQFNASGHFEKAQRLLHNQLEVAKVVMKKRMDLYLSSCNEFTSLLLCSDDIEGAINASKTALELVEKSGFRSGRLHCIALMNEYSVRLMNLGKGSLALESTREQFCCCILEGQNENESVEERASAFALRLRNILKVYLERKSLVAAGGLLAQMEDLLSQFCDVRLGMFQGAMYSLALESAVAIPKAIYPPVFEDGMAIPTAQIAGDDDGDLLLGSVPLGQWECPMCTLHNPNANQVCAVCEAPNPSAVIQAAREVSNPEDVMIGSLGTVLTWDRTGETGFSPGSSKKIEDSSCGKELERGKLSVGTFERMLKASRPPPLIDSCVTDDQLSAFMFQPKCANSADCEAVCESCSCSGNDAVLLNDDPTHGFRLFDPQPVCQRDSAVLALAAQLFKLIPHFGSNDMHDKIILSSMEATQNDIAAILMTTTNELGNTLLMTACSLPYCHSKIIASLLLRRGIDPDITNSLSQTALHIVCRNGLVSDKQVAAGVAVKKDLLYENAEELPSARSTVVKLLLAAGASVSIQDRHGCTCLHYACHCGDVEVVRLLLQAGADESSKDHLGFVPIEYCSPESIEEMSELMIKVDKSVPKLSQDSSLAVAREHTGGYGGRDVGNNWIEYVDESSGHPYYWNSVTNESTWICPFTEEQPSAPHSRRSGRELVDLWRRVAWVVGSRQVALKAKLIQRKAIVEMESKQEMVTLHAERLHATAVSNAVQLKESFDKAEELRRNLDRVASEAKQAREDQEEILVKLREEKKARREIQVERDILSSKLSDAKDDVRLAVLRARLEASKEASFGGDAQQIAVLRHKLECEEKKRVEAMNRAEALQDQLRKLESSRTNHSERVREIFSDRLERMGKKLQQERQSHQESVQQLKQSSIVKTEHEQKLAETEEREKGLRERAERLADEMRLLELDKARLREDFLVEQQLRKHYFDEVETMKGRIRVFCRLRPLAVGMDASAVTVLPDGNTLRLHHRKGVQYRFDKCFQPSSTQGQVFAELRGLIQSTIDGVNVTVLAFGPSASGKTFTIFGGSGEGTGVLPRAVSEVFSVLKREQGIQTSKVVVSAVEVYLDSILDILAQGKKGKKPKVKHLPSGDVIVENISEKEIASSEEFQPVFDAIKRSRKLRHQEDGSVTGSSASHVAVTFHIHAVNKIDGKSTMGKLSFVDLAGSAGPRELSGLASKEQQSINKSLLAFGDVLSALTTGTSHVPYRNSNLTALLADSIGGNAKTVMFVTISPSPEAMQQSASTLHFANRISSACNRGVHTGLSEVDRLKQQVALLQRKLSEKEMKATRPVKPPAKKVRVSLWKRPEPPEGDGPM